MNTERVKNMVIALLLLLNALLGGLIYQRGSAYTLSSTREAAVARLLAADNITLSAKLTRRFAPMDTLETQPYLCDLYAEAARFFPEGAALTENAYWNGAQLTDGQSALLLEDGFLMFETAEPFTTPEYARKPSDPQSARKLCDAYIERIRPQSLSFRLNRVDDGDGGVVIYDYRGVFGGKTLYSNYIKLTVTREGVTVAKCLFSGVPTAFSGAPRDVFAPDEALFALAKQLKMIYGGAEVAITNMAVVYNLEELAEEPTKAPPQYKFDVAVRAAERTYLVDCYTNAVVK